MGSDQIHVLFFPFMAQGHMLPTLDMAKLFVSRGVKTTIITTTNNAAVFTNKTSISGDQISLKIIEFPAKEVGLPDGLENLDSVKTQENQIKFFKAIELFRNPVEQILQELRPHGFVADIFFHWAKDIASKHDIPRLAFHGTSFFSMCAEDSVRRYQPHKQVKSDTEEFTLPGLPNQIKLTKNQLADHMRYGIQDDFTRMLDRAIESGNTSHGMIVNSFYELEPDYADHYRNVLGRKAWHVGPVSLCNRRIEEKVERGKKSSAINETVCLNWLNSKKPNSVIYVCFGTTSEFSDSQLTEIALGLESSGQEFIWVVRTHSENWLPENYENRIEGKGLIIRGWAPQVLILDHEAVGGFVTHCGWNSTFEGICAGVALVTWPIFAEQFYNEKLITDVLRIGVGVGAKKWVRLVGDFVRREGIERAVREVMVGEKAEEMRNRAMLLGEMARKAVDVGGSSYNDLSALINDLRNYASTKDNTEIKYQNYV